MHLNSVFKQRIRLTIKFIFRRKPGIRINFKKRNHKTMFIKNRKKRRKI